MKYGVQRATDKHEMSSLRNRTKRNENYEEERKKEDTISAS